MPCCPVPSQITPYLPRPMIHNMPNYSDPCQTTLYRAVSPHAIPSCPLPYWIIEHCAKIPRTMSRYPTPVILRFPGPNYQAQLHPSKLPNVTQHAGSCQIASCPFTPSQGQITLHGAKLPLSLPNYPFPMPNFLYGRPKSVTGPYPRTKTQYPAGWLLTPNPLA